jgi:hypothetical protein
MSNTKLTPPSKAKCAHTTGMWSSEVYLGPDGRRRKETSLTRVYQADPNERIMAAIKGLPTRGPVLIVVKQILRPAKRKGDYEQMGLGLSGI